MLADISDRLPISTIVQVCCAAPRCLTLQQAPGMVEMNGVWVEYDPDSPLAEEQEPGFVPAIRLALFAQAHLNSDDPYDPRTAPLLPPRPPAQHQARSRVLEVW